MNSRAAKDAMYRAIGKVKYTTNGIKNALLDMPTSAGTGKYRSLTAREMITKMRRK